MLTSICVFIHTLRHAVNNLSKVSGETIFNIVLSIGNLDHLFSCYWDLWVMPRTVAEKLLYQKRHIARHL